MIKIIRFLLLILLVLTLGGCVKNQDVVRMGAETNQGSAVAKKPSEIFNNIPREDMPDVVLVPRADGHELTLTLDDIGDEESVDYELLYKAGEITQGVVGSINFLKESAPFSKKLLLGSCSRGKCRYDEDVTGGELTLRFKGPQNYNLRTDFILTNGRSFVLGYSYKNFEFRFDVLSKSDYVVLMETFGLKQGHFAFLDAGPIGIFPSNNPKNFVGSLIYENSNPVYYWDGKTWLEISTGDKVEIKGLGRFLAVRE